MWDFSLLIKPLIVLKFAFQLLQYDQDEFAGQSWSFDSDGGFIYIPSGCSEKSVVSESQGNSNQAECDASPSSREECGFSGITREQCTSPERKCCWKEELPFFCFKQKEVGETEMYNIFCTILMKKIVLWARGQYQVWIINLRQSLGWGSSCRTGIYSSGQCELV